MADSKISALSAATTLGATDELVLAVSGANKRITGASMRTLGIWDAVVRKASDEACLTNAIQADDELFFTATSATFYEFECIVIYTCVNTTQDIKVAFGEDSTNRGWADVFGYSTTDSPGYQGAVQTTQGTSGSVSLGADTGKRGVICRGVILGNGGSFGLYWCQNTFSGSLATTVKAGSVLRYRALS